MAHKEKSWIVIRSYSDLTEAEIDKGILEKAAIPCYLEGAGLVASNTLLINATQGVKLRVAEEQVEKAKETLHLEN